MGTLFTATGLQQALLDEVKDLLRDIQTKNVLGETVVGVPGYEQQLPILTEDEEEETDVFPYFIVRLSDASTEDDDSPWIVSANILFGVHDKRRDASGHRHIMNMIQRTIDRFTSEPLLAGMFRAEQRMEWALQDEDTYPYYFGGVQIRFSVPKIGRREPDYGKGNEGWRDYC